jgi:protein-L-isoaspartate O-methyltransferase
LESVLSTRDAGVGLREVLGLAAPAGAAWPGHRILEIGAGTGYNAALLATLAGRLGQVTTIDINEDVTAASPTSPE